MLYPVSAQAKPTMPRLGDAVQRWLRHPEPSSSSQKSTIKEKYLYVSSLSEFFSLVRKERKGQKEECFDSRLGDADTHAPHMCQSLF